MAEFREYILSSGTKILLGKDAENNDKLVNKFKGGRNLILHTVEPGSPFCVLEKLNPFRHEVLEAGIICAMKSQDWRDNHSNVKLHMFSGNDVKKPFLAKAGTWRITNEPKVINIKKRDIENWIKKNERK